MIQAELASGRIAGPFPCPPLEPFIVSPLGLVPKKEQNKFRLIHDLSYPKHGEIPSVNDGIDPVDAAVSYETFDFVVDLIHHMGRDALLAKVDIENAFRIIPVHPSDRHLLGFSFEGEIFYDRCLPMGCRSSCAIFEAFSCAIQWIACYKLGIPGVSHILDDFIFAGPAASQITAKALDSFLHFCELCGIPIKHSKTVPPSTCITAHGIEVDSVAMEARLPRDKLERARALLADFADKKRVTLLDLQSLIGFLGFACKVIVPGRAFLRRLINLTLGVTNPRCSVKLNAEARRDIRAWLLFLESYNGVSVLPSPDFTDSKTLHLYTDASGSIGFGAVLGNRWFNGTWHSSFDDVHISTKELFPIVLVTEVWGDVLANRRVLFHTDNAAVVAIINKQSSRDEVNMHLIRCLVIALLRHNVVFKAQHIPGKCNVLADMLSRFQLQAARRHAPWLDPQLTTIPPHLLTLHQVASRSHRANSS